MNYTFSPRNTTGEDRNLALHMARCIVAGRLDEYQHLAAYVSAGTIAASLIYAGVKVGGMR